MLEETKDGQLPRIYVPDWVPTYVIVHHSATADGRQFDAAAIRKYHIEVKGWSDVGYHFLVELVGEGYEIVTGRPMSRPGAHCKDGNMNHMSIGVCLVGNWDSIAPPAQQWTLGLRLVKSIQSTLKIRTDHVLGHREAQERAGLTPEQRKSCPGRSFDMDKFRADLAALL